MRCVMAFALSIAVVTPLLSQQVGQNKTPDQAQEFTLSVHSNLVVEAVTVKDKQGNFIRGLTAQDFVLTEDGTSQSIRNCEHQNLAETAKPLQAEAPSDEKVTIYNRLSHTQIEPEPLDNQRYKDRRLLAFYFDSTALPPGDQFRALDAAQRFIRTKMTTADRIAILRYAGGSVDILQDFTSDRDRLLSILETLAVGEGQGEASSISDASSADSGAAFGQNDSEFNIFNTDRQLAALQTAAQMLGHVSEKNHSFTLPAACT